MEKNNKPFTAKQIIDKLGESSVCVQRGLKKLMQYNEIGFYELSSDQAMSILDYSIKRRVCIYFPLNYKFNPPED